MGNKVDYKKLYKLTSLVTPLEDDCGIRCGRACCSVDNKNPMGMYLFPGEEAMFSGKENWLLWESRDPGEDGFPPSWLQPVYFVRCNGICPREKRPLSCRLFPLAPHLLKDNSLLLIYEALKLPYKCPLINDKAPLLPLFIDTVALCWKELLKDKRIRDLVVMDSTAREKKVQKPCVVWWETS